MPFLGSRTTDITDIDASKTRIAVLAAISLAATYPQRGEGRKWPPPRP
jgi:hypothetical protein